MNPNQQLFNDAFRGIASQDFRQSADKGSCMYRGPEGLRCVLGHCIPDDEYDPHFEGAGVTAEPRIGQILRNRYGQLSMEFLLDLQDTHDTSSTCNRAGFEQIARRYKLEIPDA